MSRSSVLKARGLEVALGRRRAGGLGGLTGNRDALLAAIVQRGFHQAAGNAGALEAGGDDRDAHFVPHVRVDDRTEDQVDVRVSGLLDDGGRLVDLEQAQTRARR